MKQCPKCNRLQAFYIRFCQCGYAFGQAQEEEHACKGSTILALCSVLAGLQALGAFLLGMHLMLQKRFILAALLSSAGIVYSLGMMIVFTEVNELIAKRERDDSPERESHRPPSD